MAEKNSYEVNKLLHKTKQHSFSNSGWQ